MTPQEYFGDWFPYINVKALETALNYVTREPFYPNADKVFKAFTMCSARDIKAIFLGQDPYPQKDRATGLAFANPANILEENLSPSLQVLKEAVINYEIPHNIITFDNTLESWAKQGILLLNSALTVKPFHPNSHSFYWKEFIDSFLKRFSESHGGIAYVLFGKKAQAFEPSISPLSGKIFKTIHPAAVARNPEEKIPYSLFIDIRDYIYKTTGKLIFWFYEETY